MKQLIFGIWFLFIAGVAFAQQRTTIQILCDQPNLPIYLDGVFIGKTPFDKPIDVIPGWHKVSVFPLERWSTFEKIEQDIIRLGIQDVLVENGDNAVVTLSYKSLQQDVNDYYQSIHAGSLIGFAMILVLLSIIVWGYV